MVERSCGFKSHLPHNRNGKAIRDKSFSVFSYNQENSFSIKEESEILDFFFVKQKDFTALPVIIYMRLLFFHREGDRS